MSLQFCIEIPYNYLIRFELPLELFFALAKVTVDVLLASRVRYQIGVQKASEQLYVVHVGPRVRQVFFARLDVNQGSDGVLLGSEAQTWINPKICGVYFLLVEYAKLIVVGGLSLVYDGHKDGHHHGEETGYSQVEAAIVEAETSPGETVAATHLLAVRIPEEEQKVVELVREAEAILDYELFLVH